MISRRDRLDKSELATSVDSLRDEVRVLREVLDEIRDALQWQNNNAADLPLAVASRPPVLSLAEASLPAANLRDEPNESTASIPSDCRGTQRDLF